MKKYPEITKEDLTQELKRCKEEQESKATNRREELRIIFEKHKYHNMYGNRVGYRIEDVMGDIEEYMDKNKERDLLI